MMPPIEEVVTFVQHLAPTWRKELQQTCAEVLAAFWERSCLCLSDLARVLPDPQQSLHGRLKRFGRWLDNPHRDELALSVRWLILAYQWVVQLPEQPSERPLLPILLDTVLLATVPCGSRGLPIALTTYHRKTLEACFLPEATWPEPTAPTSPTLRQRLGLPARPPLAASTKQAFRSQHHIEEHLLALVLRLVCRRRPQGGRLRPVIVADRRFARASLFVWLRERCCDFVIRFDAETHVYLDADGESQPVATALPVQRGEQRWAALAWYQQEERVPMGMLAVWDKDAEEPWHLGTSLGRADWTAQCSRWCMRCECTHRDEKTGILLRCGGDDHQLTNGLHLHRLVLALCLAEWLCALVGLQAWRELPALLDAPLTLLTPEQEANAAPLTDPDQLPLEAAPPLIEPDAAYLAQGPADPPPVRPHRGPTYKPPQWLRRFEARGPLSYPRLGWEVLQAADLRPLVRRLVHWVGIFLWLDRPYWRPWQIRYRLRPWWPDARAA